MNAPADSKPRGLVLVGESNAGKTRTMQAFRDLHKPQIVPDAQFAEYQAIYIGAPDEPSMPIVYNSILDALNHPLFYHRDEVTLRKHTVKMVRGCNVGVIMIDELHDISRQRMSNLLLDLLGQMKNFINDTGRPFVVGGVKVIAEILSQDEQIASRFPHVVEMKPISKKGFVDVLADPPARACRRATSASSRPGSAIPSSGPWWPSRRPSRCRSRRSSPSATRSSTIRVERGAVGGRMRRRPSRRSVGFHPGGIGSRAGPIEMRLNHHRRPPRPGRAGPPPWRCRRLSANARAS